MLAPDSPHELAAHTWTSVVGNELADAFAEKGALLHEVPIDVVRAVGEADFLAVHMQKQLYTTAIQAVPELKGSGGSQAHSAPFGGCYGPRFAEGSAQVAEALALLSLRTNDCSQATSRMAVERALCPAVAYDASGPFPRLSARIDWPAGYAWIPQIGLQAGYLVVRGMWLLGFFGSANLEQALYRPRHKSSEGRSGSFGQGAHAATPRPVAVSAPLKGELSGLGYGNARRRPKDRAQRLGVIRMKTRGAGPRTAPR